MKYTMMFALRLYFKKISFTNKSNYPSKGPVILAAMHPNSFIDDMVLGAFTRRQLTFLARGDVFNTPLKRFILGQMFVSPIYRAMDNAQDVKKNIDALDSYSKKLQRGRVLLMHPEGICVNEKRVRKMRKGTARIAFAAEEASDFNLGVKIVPVSLNYTNAPKLRERLMIDFGEPIELKKYEEMYKENSAKAMLEFNNELYDALVSKSVHIEEKEAESVVEQCLEIAVNNNPPKVLPIYDEDNSHLAQEKNVSDTVNHLYKTSKSVFDKLKHLTNEYTAKLKSNKVGDEAFVNSGNVAFRALLLLLLSPIFAFGYMANILPVLLGSRLTNKVVKTDEFYGSVYVGASWIFGLIYYLIIGVLVASLTPYSGILVVFAIAFLGFWSVLLRDKYIQLFKQIRYNKVLKSNPSLYQEMQKSRTEILNLLHSES